MTTRPIDRAVLAFLSASALAFLVASCPVVGQQRELLSPGVALARLCVSEAGWTCFDTGDGLAIHEVLLRGSARQSIRYTSFARAYAGRLFGARPHDVPRLRWIGQMNETGDAPRDWPATYTRRRRGVTTIEAHAPWATFRARWLAILARAQEIVTTNTLDDIDEWGSCERAVHDWGGWMDRDRAERMGLVEVNCDTFTSATDEAGEVVQTRIETANDFYCRPSVDSTCVQVDRR